MFEASEVVSALVALLAAVPATYATVRKRLSAMLSARLEAISGGQVQTLEDLVAAALEQRRIRETPITVYGDPKLWQELRKGRFSGAVMCGSASGRGDVAIVDVESMTESEIALLHERWILIYKEKVPYRGSLPEGAYVTYANTLISLDARTVELLNHRARRV